MGLIKDERVWKETCKIGQGEKCCRYLTVGGKGFECEKLNPSMKAILDERVANLLFTARGDNCEGM